MQIYLRGYVYQSHSCEEEEEGNLQNAVITTIKCSACPTTTNVFQKKGLESIVLFYLQTVMQTKEAENHCGNKFAVKTMHVSLRFICEASVRTL